MKKVERSEILPIGEYEPIRERFRARIILEKRARRLQVSDIISVTFENRDTVLLQIQEMLRTERITSESGILHEIDTYNELVPGDLELSITLFVEIPEKEKRDHMLVELTGLEDHVSIDIGGKRFKAHGKRLDDGFGRTTAVHYLKFVIDETARARLQEGNAKAAFVITHPKHEITAPLSAPTLRSLASDFL